MTLRDVAAIVLAAAVLLLPALPVVDLFNPDEPREAEIAREMRETGDLVVPLFDGCPFLEKPPLFYWAVLLAGMLPGIGRETVARLPSVAAAIGLLLVVYFLGRELFDRRTARAGAFLLLTTFQFWWLAKRAVLDMTLAFFVGAAMLCFLLGHRRTAHRARWFLLGGAACAGAVMTKGLIGILVPGVAVAAYLWWRQQTRLMVSPALLAAAAIPLAALGLWVLLLSARPEGACYVRDFLVENHLKRFLGGGYGGHRQPFWYYLGALATDFQPWVLFLPGAAIALWPGFRASRASSLVGPAFLTGSGERDAFLHAWLLPPLILLSAASSKRSLYLLPLAAPAALLVAAWWRQWTFDRQARTIHRGRKMGLPTMVSAWILLLIGIVLAIALPVVIGALSTGADIRTVADIASVLSREPLGIPAGAALLAAVLVVAWLSRRSPRRGARAAVIVVWAFLLTAGCALVPLAGGRVSARPLGEAIRAARDRGVRIAAYRLTEGSLGQFLFYSEGLIERIGRASRRPESACTDCRLSTSPEEFLLGPGRRACLFLNGDYEKLPVHLRRGRILARGKIGGASYVLLAGPVRAPETVLPLRRSEDPGPR